MFYDKEAELFICGSSMAWYRSWILLQKTTPFILEVVVFGFGFRAKKLAGIDRGQYKVRFYRNWHPAP